MKRVSTLFLKGAVLFIGIPILLLCIFLVPELARISTSMLPDFTAIKYIVFIIFYASTVPFYFALYQAIQLLNYMDKQYAFSQRSVQALKKINYCALAIAFLHLLVLPLFYVFAEIDDAPGVILVGLVVPFASLTIAVFAAVLQKLLEEAISIKSENDLTV